MKKISFFKFFIFVFFISTLNPLFAEIIILSTCDNQKDGFLKNEYILDLEKSIMTRNYIYNQKTFQKYKLTDLSVKKKILLNDLFILKIIKS